MKYILSIITTHTTQHEETTACKIDSSSHCEVAISPAMNWSHNWLTDYYLLLLKATVFAIKKIDHTFKDNHIDMRLFDMEN